MEEPPMSHRGPSALAPILWILFLLALVIVPTLYVAGYFCLGKHAEVIYLDSSTAQTKTMLTRGFSQSWLVTLYKPAGLVESWVRGEPVYIERKTEWMDNY
jgi:hypothetical protein